MALHPLRDHPWSNLLSCITHLTSIYFCLVVAFTIITWWPSNAKLYFICDFFGIQIVALSDRKAPLHSRLPPLITSFISTLSGSSIAGRLLCIFIKFWPFKANERLPLNFSTCVVWQPPNKQTNYGATKSDPRPCVVGAADLPMEVEEKAAGLGGRVAAAHVGCCVCFCVFVLGMVKFWLRFESTKSVHNFA